MSDETLVYSIRDLIRREGPISFDRFMEQALYHPEHGYYSSGRSQIGRRGDYFTSVSAGPVFGTLLAGQFAEIWESLGRPNDFAIVEQGAHHGEFAGDVLEALREQHPELFVTVRYRIVEPFAVLRRRQEGVLRQFANRVEWGESVEKMTPFCGIHFSNELLDAFPVHLLVGKGAQMFAHNMGFKIEEDLNTDHSRQLWLEWKRRTDPSHYLDPKTRGEVWRREGMKMVAEGVLTTGAALELGAKYGVELPITTQMAAVLDGRVDVRTALDALMLRKQRAETETR